MKTKIKKIKKILILLSLLIYVIGFSQEIEGFYRGYFINESTNFSISLKPSFSYTKYDGFCIEKLTFIKKYYNYSLYKETITNPNDPCSDAYIKIYKQNNGDLYIEYSIDEEFSYITHSAIARKIKNR